VTGPACGTHLRMKVHAPRARKLSSARCQLHLMQSSQEMLRAQKQARRVVARTGGGCWPGARNSEHGHAAVWCGGLRVEPWAAGRERASQPGRLKATAFGARLEPRHRHRFTGPIPVPVPLPVPARHR